MRRRSLLTVVSLPLLFAACAHRGRRPSASEDLGGGTFCVVRPPAPAASLPSYTLAAVQDSALVGAQVGQLVLFVESSGSEDHRPVPHAIATLQVQQRPSASAASDPPARVKLVAWGQADSVGQIVLPVLPAGRYPGELLGWRYHSWTGHVDVRAGYTDTVRIGLSAKAPLGEVAMEPCS